ncbi:hypothetical protein IEO21_10212 [Rhodonia placenta]|uniref:Uncharacterized protein n=1 Tax=Rhodonia placenta TaxID=104341 RepID=A0A8H7NSX8_9APHY|nr:hypothetical protein IEO21_10212 [Postia placenta]
MELRTKKHLLREKLSYFTR